MVVGETRVPARACEHAGVWADSVVAAAFWQMAVLADHVPLFKRYTNNNGIFDKEAVGCVLKIALLNLENQPLKSLHSYSVYFVMMMKVAGTGMWACIGWAWQWYAGN